MTQDYLEHLTPQQRAAVEHKDGAALVLAGPGSGKTRVITYRLIHLIRGHRVNPRGIVAITFTNKAANEMQERAQQVLPKSATDMIHISTFHSFCARLLRYEHEAAGLVRHYTICDDSDTKAYIIQSIALEVGEDPKKVRGMKDHRAPDKVQRFISKQKQRIFTPDDVFDNLGDGADEEDLFYAKCYARYQATLTKSRCLDFDDLIMRTVLLLRDNEYVRTKYAKRIEYLLVDESQDTNPSQYELVKHLSSYWKNVFMVGDSDQCLLPSTKVETPAGKVRIDELNQGNEIVCAAGRDTTAVSSVEQVYKRRHKGEVTTLVTSGGRKLTGTAGHCVFSRPNTASAYYHTYLMFEKTKGYRVGRTGPKRSDGKKHKPGFIQRLNQERADAIWVVKSCKTEADSAYWEAYYAAKYGLPTCCFHAAGRRLAMDEERISKLFTALDTEGGAIKLLSDVGLSVKHPHYVPQATTTKSGKTRNTVTMTMFGSTRQQKNNVGRGGVANVKNPWYQHELSVCSSVQNDAFRREVESILTTSSHKGKYWQARKSLGNYDDVLTLSVELEEKTRATVRRRARITSESYDYIPLAHVIPGMLVPTINELGEVQEEEVLTVEKTAYDGLVYDVGVEDLRNFVADGIVVHNSIYRFRGAQPENMAALSRDYDGSKTYFLEDNFRSTHQIAAVANNLIANNEGREAKEIKARVDGGPVKCIECLDNKQEAAIVVDQILTEVRNERAKWNDFAILYRMHTRSRIFEELMVTNNIPHRIIGGLGFYNRAIIKDIIAYLKLVLNGADDASFIRIYNKPPRGFGDTSYAKLYHLKEERDCHILTVFKKRYYEEVLKGRSLRGAENIREVMAALHQMPQDRVAPLIEKVIEATRYRQILEAEGDAKSLGKIEHMDELIQAATEFDDAHGSGLLRFIEWTALMQSADAETDEARVHLMTCHAAKGLEFPKLYVIGAIDGVMPIVRDVDDFGRLKQPEQMQKDLEEERRVFFVALTRAERELTITHTRQEMRYNQLNDCTPSRFLEELGDAVEHESLASTNAGSYLLGALSRKRAGNGRGRKRGGFTYKPNSRRRKRY